MQRIFKCGTIQNIFSPDKGLSILIYGENYHRRQRAHNRDKP